MVDELCRRMPSYKNSPYLDKVTLLVSFGVRVI
jgi:hypothetical protein